MFDTLSDRIRRDEFEEVTVTQRIIRWATVAVVSILLFGSLYFIVQHLG